MKYNYKLPPLLRTLGEIFIPDIAQSISSFVAALVIYFAVSASYYWEIVTGDDLASKGYTARSFSDATTKLSHLPGGSSIGIILLWGLVGIGIYFLLLQAINLYISAKNNALLNDNVRDNPKLLAFSLLSEYRRIVWIILLVVVVGVSLAKLWSFWSQCFRIFNELGHEPKFLVLGLLGLALNLYLIFSFTMAAWRNPKINL